MVQVTTGFQELSSNPGVAALSYVRALTTLYGFAPRIPDPAKAPRDDPTWWRKALRDPVVRKAVMKRTYAVAGRHWRVAAHTESSPTDKIVASCLEGALKEIRLFDHARALLATAIFRGSSYAYIQGERRFLSIGIDSNGVPFPPMWWWVPTDLIDVDPLRFEVRRDPETQTQRWYFGSVDLDAAQEKGLSAYDNWAPLEHPEWFVRHVYEPTEQSLRYGQGLQDALEFSLWAKQDLWRNFLSGARRAGIGFFDVSTNDVRAGANDLDNANRVQDWKTACSIAREDGDIIHAPEDVVKLLEVPIEGLQIIRQQILDLNEDMTSLILFGVLPTGGGNANGSYARAETEADSGREAFFFDQAGLSESITEGVLALTFALNKANLDRLAPGGRRGRFETVNEERPDPKGSAEVVRLLQAAGAKLRTDEVLERCGGWTVPKPGEDVLEPAGVASTLTAKGSLPAGGEQLDDEKKEDEAPAPSSSPEKNRDAKPEKFLSTEATRPADTHLHLTVSPPSVTVEASAPVVVPAPNVKVTNRVEAPVIPPAKVVVRPEAPIVHVETPAPIVVPAPEVTVHVPEPRPRRIEIEKDKFGNVTGARSEPQP